MKKAKKCVLDEITPACNAMYELNVRLRFILRPFVHKRFPQLCAATSQIEEKTFFSSDITKRMKDISNASKINKQLLTGFLRNIQSKIFRGKMNLRERTNQFNPYSRGGGRSSRSRGSGYNCTTEDKAERGTADTSRIITCELLKFCCRGFRKKCKRMGEDNFRFVDS